MNVMPLSEITFTDGYMAAKSFQPVVVAAFVSILGASIEAGEVDSPQLAPIAQSTPGDDLSLQQVSYELTQPDELFAFAGSNPHGHGGRRSKADKHAPAGLMGAHVHGQGEVMVEYKYMNMYMDDNRIGTRTIADAATRPIVVDGQVTNLGATPTAMTMEMHMVHIMYGVTDDISVYTMLMLPSLTMDHQRGPMNPAGPGTPFTTHNSGFGDTSFGALVRLWNDDDNDFIANLGFSVPTGDIFRTTTVPTNGALTQPLPYPMRLGSGTFNARPGVTWKHFTRDGSFGVQFQTDLPFGHNYRGYSVGDTFQLNTWYSHLLTDNLALSIRLENVWKTNYDGADPETPNPVISTNVESFRGGYWVNLGIGASALVKGHLFSVEFVPTLFQDLNGIQLETDWSFIASWSKSF